MFSFTKVFALLGLWLCQLSYGQSGGYNCSPMGCFKTGRPSGNNSFINGVQYRTPQGTSTQMNYGQQMMNQQPGNQQASFPSKKMSQPMTPPMKKLHPPTPSSPPPRVIHHPPTKKEEVKEEKCITPAEFGKSIGITIINTCEDIEKYLLNSPTFDVVDGITGDNCEWFYDETCFAEEDEPKDKHHKKCNKHSKDYAKCRKEKESSSALDALKEYRKRNNSCLVFDTKPKNGLVRYSHVNDDEDTVVDLCCKPICTATTTTTTTVAPITTTTTEAPQELLLDLDETTTSTMGPIFPYLPPPTPETQKVDTDEVEVKMRSRAQCIDVQYLHFAKVTTCEDLRDVALSTDYLSLTDRRSVECKWVTDYTCDDSFPDFGAHIHSGKPEGICLAYRDSTCGNIVGPFPILQSEEREVCRNKNKGHKHKQQMMPVMMMPAPSKKGGDGDAHHGGGLSRGRRLVVGEEDEFEVIPDKTIEEDRKDTELTKQEEHHTFLSGDFFVRFMDYFNAMIHGLHQYVDTETPAASKAIEVAKEAHETLDDSVNENSRVASEASEGLEETDLSLEVSARILQKGGGKKEQGLPSSVTVPLCCRLDCGGGVVQSYSAMLSRTQRSESSTGGSRSESRNGGANQRHERRDSFLYNSDNSDLFPNML